MSYVSKYLHLIKYVKCLAITLIIVHLRRETLYSRGRVRATTGTAAQLALSWLSCLLVPADATQIPRLMPCEDCETR